MNADLQILTQPGSTGNQTYSLASNFNPAAVILWAVPLAADGTAASYALGVGFGTYRGGAVQQRFVTMRGLDAATSADNARGAGSNALLVIQTQSAGAATRDLEIDLVSMATGASSNVILNWANLHTTASVKVFMLVLGGAEVSDALADHLTYPTTTTTWDEIVGVSSAGTPVQGTSVFATSGNVTPGLPAVSNGDIQVLRVASADNVVSTVTGWTSVIATNQGTTLRQSIFKRVRQGGDTAPTVTHAAGSTIHARITGLPGCTDVEASGAQGGAASATVTAPTITPTNPGTILLAFWAEENTGDTSGSPTWGGYSDGATELDDAANGLGTDELAVATSWRLKKDVAATGAITATVTGESGTPDNTLGTIIAATPSSFSAVGQPDLVFFAGNGPLTEVATTPKFTFGFGKKGEAGRSVAFSQVDGNTASLVAMRQRSDRALMSILATGASAGTDEALGQLDTTLANWPANGFRLVFDANPAAADVAIYLALKGTFQSATGSNTAVIAGSPPVTQDNAAGFAPKLGLVFGWSLAAATTLDTTSTDLGGFGIGAYDGTDQGWAGLTEDDALGTMDSNQQQETDHILANYVAATIQSSATAAFSGNNFRLSWDDIDSVARQYQWLALGDAAAATTTAPPPPRRVNYTWYRRIA